MYTSISEHENKEKVEAVYNKIDQILQVEGRRKVITCRRELKEEEKSKGVMGD